MIRPILIHPDPRLKKVVDPVAEVDDAVRKLADDMLETMYDAPGIGLAGPQIGAMKRMFVMDVAEKDAEPEPMVLINPEILWSSEEEDVYEEGCLSIPDIYAEVTRPAEIEMRWTDRDGAMREGKFDGLAATCAQHELDHLNGKLFIDYLGSVKRMTITNKMKKLKKSRA
ncbi:peptide deformylase [Pontivivens insulae]|uniref:Peptide deformylase n=1 Tax=Pontivivens insulae TaxID=1639689 RepID=A0A2R8ACY0_9RHOB|nr:peptide deformylase [Pontivivens insulae]RED13846.1 peptide deformylase [Pontivivens insulae]SPF29920.1 Peptide deformylase [Pontivivens insulae]